MARNFTRRSIKFFHTVTGLGLVGGLAAYMLVLWSGPGTESLEAYAAMRESLATVSRGLILPSMAGVLVSGLLAMGMNFSYMEAPWAWLKLLSGVLVFEATLASVDGPARSAAILSRKALDGEVDGAALAAGVRDEWGAYWVLLSLAIVNIALATWRPRFRRRMPEAGEEE
jgi:hypothetical protein